MWKNVVQGILKHSRVGVQLSPLDNFYESKMAAKIAKEILLYGPLIMLEKNVIHLKRGFRGCSIDIFR